MADDNDNDVTEQLKNSGAIGRVSDEAEDEDTIVTTLDDDETEKEPVDSDEWWTLYQHLTKLVQIRVQSVTKRLKNNITGQNTANDTTKNELLVKNYGKN